MKNLEPEINVSADFFHVKISNQLVIFEAELGEDGKGITISSFDSVHTSTVFGHLQ